VAVSDAADVGAPQRWHAAAADRCNIDGVAGGGGGATPTMAARSTGYVSADAATGTGVDVDRSLLNTAGVDDRPASLPRQMLGDAGRRSTTTACRSTERTSSASRSAPTARYAHPANVFLLLARAPYRGAGTNLKVGGGANVRLEVPKFFVVPLHFFGCTISHFGKCFRNGQ